MESYHNCCVNQICRIEATDDDASTCPKSCSFVWETASGNCGRGAAGLRWKWRSGWELTEAFWQMLNGGKGIFLS
jgi:hypothetical protein